MSVRAAIYSLLSGLEGDVFPLNAQQETTVPYVVYSMSITPTRTQSGVGVTDVSLTLEIYANSFSDCITLADTLYTGLEGTSGTYATETLHISNWVSESDFYVRDLNKYSITQEYQLRFI